MIRRNQVIVLFSTVLAFSALYAPQPLLPVLARDLAVSESAAALLITVTLVPLGIAPIAYGFLLEAVSARRVLIVAAGLLGLTSLGLALAPAYPAFLALRFCQGLLIPAMLTALMTHVASTATEARLPRAMAVYVAATVFGGFAGRAASGLISDLAGWQTTFLTLGVLLCVASASLTRLPADASAKFSRVHPRVIPEVLRIPGVGSAYLTIFCAFFVFASLLNFLPFRAADLRDGMGSAAISLIYSGYLMGIVTSLLAARLAIRLGGESRAVVAGLCVFMLATGLFLVPSVPFLYVNMFLFCGGMFLIHGLLPGQVNRLAPERRGLVNGLYIAAYYAGGSTGSYLPGLLLRQFGWTAFVMSLCLVLSLAVMLAVRDMLRTPAKNG
ncbi:YNFM family putative membrane transporter [Natronocella acetinitrilica]|uniref:YNFM family putative membrane transporter n=1 Tax=Natronocella acetinitrilica TaxID=414046 RepID=A0AAE3G6D2_9GAMM|nr:MFS transporter [Natronocella acetinitrilica]MCP1675938.1 YNFM family putative membrane transporter [Natronocella acetinitrilica]